MQSIAIIDGFFNARYAFFKWRYSLALVNKIALALGMACVTGLLAQVRIGLPFSPVPITGQTFAVLLAGVILGRRWGGISQVIYVMMGVAGIPWFAGGSAGYAALIGPSGGYMTGFVLAAYFLGHFSDKYVRARSFFPMLGLMLFANFVLIHIPGLLQLAVWFRLAKGALPSFWNLLWMGTLPFVIGDIIKIAAAATVAYSITPKKPFN